VKTPFTMILFILITGCTENYFINPATDNFQTVTICYSPINNTDLKIVWHEATIFLEGDSVGIVYPDSTCLSIRAEYRDSVVATFSADMVSGDKIMTTKFMQHLVVGKTDTSFVIP
jgi:hypothetical protein